MKNLVFIFLIGLLIHSSCTNSDTSEPSNTNNQEEEEIKEIDTTSILPQNPEDTIVKSRPIINIESLLNKIDTSYTTPFKLDSNYVENVSMSNNDISTLTNIEVQYLGFDMVKNQPTEWADYNIGIFIELDSMIINGTYDDYVESIDIGMMERSFANIHSKIVINDNTFILLWSISFSTFEACPFSSGTVIFGTFFNENLAYNTAALGESSGGGDAPYWNDTFITSEIHSTKVSTRKIEQIGGEDDEETGEEIVEITDKIYNLKITKLGFEVIGKEQD